MAKTSKPINHEIKAYLNSLKKSSGVSSKQIAVALQVSPQTVSALLMRGDHLSIVQATKLAELFKIPSTDLILQILKRSTDVVLIHQANCIQNLEVVAAPIVKAKQKIIKAKRDVKTD